MFNWLTKIKWIMKAINQIVREAAEQTVTDMIYDALIMDKKKWRKKWGIKNDGKH